MLAGLTSNRVARTAVAEAGAAGKEGVHFGVDAARRPAIGAPEVRIIDMRAGEADVRAGKLGSNRFTLVFNGHDESIARALRSRWSGATGVQRIKVPQ